MRSRAPSRREPNRRNLLAEKLQISDRILPGVLLGSQTISLIHYFHTIGFEWALLDAEHQPLTVNQCWEATTLCDALGMATIIRVPGSSLRETSLYAESGASCLLAPRVNSPEDASTFVTVNSFGSESGAGVYSRSKLMGYGLDARSVPADPLFGVLLESSSALEKVEAIAQIPGVDLVAFGPTDLAASMGLASGKDPTVVALIEKASKSLSITGTTVLLPSSTALEVERVAALGARLFLVDPLSVLNDGLQALLGENG